MTVREVTEKVMNYKDKININPNYLEIGVSVISYGLLIKSFNKLVYDKYKIPRGNIEEIKVARQVKNISRLYFAAVSAPFMLVMFNLIRARQPLVEVSVNMNDKENNNKSLMFLLFLRKMK
jgi:hypothetical protein